MTPVQMAMLMLVGGAVFTDRTALIQSMVSRPLVSGLLAGMVLEDPWAGLLCGAMLELVWLFDLPVGSRVPPDESVAGLAATAAAVFLPAGWSLPARVGLGVTWGLVAGAAGGRLDVAVRRWNADLVVRAREAGGATSLARLHWLGVLRFFCAGVVLALGGVAGGWGVARLAGAAVPAAGFELVFAVLPPLGAGACLGGMRLRGASVWFGSGALAGAGLAQGTGGMIWGRIPWRS